MAAARYAVNVANHVIIVAAAGAPVVQAANIAAYNANFNLAVEMRLPDWPAIIGDVNAWVDAVAAALQAVHAGAVDAYRTRILWGLAMYCHTSSANALGARGRGYTFVYQANDNTNRRYTLKKECLQLLLSRNAANAQTVTMYRVAAVTLDMFAIWSAATQYVPNWFASVPPAFAGFAELAHVPYEYRTLANAHLNPNQSNTALAKTIRDGFHAFMTSLPVNERPRYSRNVSLENQVAAAPKTPQILDVANCHVAAGDGAIARI